jgi:hypothetical protein
MTFLRYWNDDDRKNDYITYYDNKEEEHIPVYKILKEMYDEDKENLYIYDLDEEYRYKYSECYYDNYNSYSYDFNDLYPMSLSSHLDDNVESDVEVVEDDDNTSAGVETIASCIEKDVKEHDEETYQNIACNKFIYT